MSITKEIINLLNGEIKIESELNIGSKVSVRLKLEKSEIIDISGMKVLVAEDNYFNREIISLLLNELNVECDIVNNGKELIEKLKHGVTQINVHGVYSNTDKTMLVCIINKRQIGEMMKIIKILCLLTCLK